MTEAKRPTRRVVQQRDLADDIADREADLLAWKHLDCAPAKRVRDTQSATPDPV